MKNLENATVVELRKEASRLGIKNYTKFKKEELRGMISKLMNVKPVSKSDLLRGVLKELNENGSDLGSGKLMNIMKDQGVTMHRSFVITVRNEFISNLENLKA